MQDEVEALSILKCRKLVISNEII